MVARTQLATSADKSSILRQQFADCHGGLSTAFTSGSDTGTHHSAADCMFLVSILESVSTLLQERVQAMETREHHHGTLCAGDCRSCFLVASETVRVQRAKKDRQRSFIVRMHTLASTIVISGVCEFWSGAGLHAGS